MTARLEEFAEEPKVGNEVLAITTAHWVCLAPETSGDPGRSELRGTAVYPGLNALGYLLT
jgi:hypothetical protein